MTQDIFSLFGVEVEEVKVEKKEVKKVAKPAATAPAKEDAALEINTSTVIRYGGQDIPILTYFGEDEIKIHMEKKSITEEEVRKRMEDDYAELVPNHTAIIYHKEKNLVIPVLQAKKKGNLPKIPFHLINEFVAIAREFAKLPVEIHADIYFDLDLNKYFMDFPQQSVNKYRAERTESAIVTAIKFIERKYRKIMEIHSHHVWDANPSYIDDEAERSPILYAIVGNLNKLYPSITLRTFDKLDNCHLKLEPSDFIEIESVTFESNYDLSEVAVTL